MVGQRPQIQTITARARMKAANVCRLVLGSGDGNSCRRRRGEGGRSAGVGATRERRNWCASGAARSQRGPTEGLGREKAVRRACNHVRRVVDRRLAVSHANAGSYASLEWLPGGARAVAAILASMRRAI